MRSLLSVFLVSLLLVAASAADYEVEDEVLVLKESNFDEALKEFPKILVEFYAPWCGHCKSLAPEYAAAAKALKEEGSALKLAKVDATVESEIASKHEVRGYPTLKFFVNGEAMEYNGGRTKTEIISWLKKKDGPSFVSLKTVEEAEKFAASEEVVALGYAKDETSKVAELFKKTSESVDEVPFGFTTDAAIIKKYGLSGDEGVVLLRKFDKKPLAVPSSLDTTLGVKDFILNHLLPPVVEFTDEVAPRIFGGTIKVHSLLFLDGSKDTSAILKWYREIADSKAGRMMFIYVDVKKASNTRILDYFGIKADSVPEFRLIEMGSENMNKFKPTKAVSKEVVSEMLDKFEKKELEPFYKSEPVPENWDKEPVKVLVGENFNKVVYDEKKNVLVKFYAPWCGHCKSLAPIWEELGAKYADSEDIMIAKIDSTANEIPDIPITGFPTIKFFPAGGKSVVDYDGGRDLESFVSFLDSKVPKAAEEGSDEL